MRRQLFNLAATVSLMLCVATLALWVRSYWRVDNAGRFGLVKSIHISSFCGSLSFGLYGTYPEDTMGRSLPFSYYVSGKNAGSFWHEMFRFDAGIDFKSGSGFVRAPHWCVALVLSVVPLRWGWMHWRTRRRALHGRCLQCGYDLIATPDRCPECGAIPSAAPATAA